MIVNSSQAGPARQTTDFERVSAWEPPVLPGLRQGGEWSGQQQQQQQQRA